MATIAPFTASELQRRYNHAIAAVAGSDNELPITVRGKEEAVLMGAERAREASQALALVRGLARLADSNEDVGQLLAQLTTAQSDDTQELNASAA